MARPGLLQHRKFRRLSLAVGDRALALGCLELMWSGAYENGDEYLGDAIDVETAADWKGERGVLLKALLDAGGGDGPGFIEEISDRPGRYQIHDLWHHCPDYVRKRRSREERRREKGGPSPVGDRTAADNDRSVTGQRTTTPDSRTELDRTPSSQHPAPKDQNQEHNTLSSDEAAGKPPSSGPKGDGPDPPAPGHRADTSGKPEDLREAWNRECPSLPKCIALSEKRRTHCRARLKERPLAEWADIFRRIEASPFCRGEGSTGWKATFDWIIGSTDNAIKVLEGKYDAPSRASPAGGYELNPLTPAERAYLEAKKGKGAAQ